MTYLASVYQRAQLAVAKVSQAGTWLPKRFVDYAAHGEGLPAWWAARALNSIEEHVGELGVWKARLSEHRGGRGGIIVVVSPSFDGIIVGRRLL